VFKTVVVGADASDTARRAVEAAAEIAKMSGASLHIVTAYGPKSFNDSFLPNELRHMNVYGDVEALLQDLSFVARNKGVEAETHGVAGAAAEAVIEYATKVNADLVVVGNRGMQGVRRALGSIPNSVAHGAPCSVAIIDTTE
jgi:nucleotide-binding universal stress UspA family protein